MSLIEFALFFSAVIALYNIQKIKIILKEKGYPVEMLTGWMADYRQFKRLIEKEPDQKSKIRYQQILNGLLFSLGGLVFFAAMAFYNRM